MRLEFGGSDLVAFDFDEFFDAVDNEEVFVSVLGRFSHERHVPCAAPAVGEEGLRCGGGVVEIS